MRKKGFLKFLLIFISFLLLIYFIKILIVVPFIAGKIETELNTKGENYKVDISKIRWNIFTSSIELRGISVENKGHINYYITSLLFRRIKIIKALTKKDVSIGEIILNDSEGTLRLGEEKKQSFIIPFNLSIDSVEFLKAKVTFNNLQNNQTISLNNANLKLIKISLKKNDSVKINAIKEIRFKIQEFSLTSADSNYTYKASDIECTSDIIKLKNLEVIPNYSEYSFTRRFQYEIDRLNLSLNEIEIDDFSLIKYLRSDSLVSSRVLIGEMNLNVFRDKRKPFKHKNKPTFQELFYNYSGFMLIDSLKINGGDIAYVEHADNATEAGYVTFNKINFSLYNITNDTAYKSREGWLKLNAEALFMNEGKTKVTLKSRLFERNNSFIVNGSLADFKIGNLNPLLEKSAFIKASGKLELMSFQLMANNSMANGTLIMKYDNMSLEAVSKYKTDNTVIKDQIKTFFINLKVLDSNPLNGEEVRQGTISYKRDPERFVFNYTLKSILTGIQSSISKKQ